MTHENPNAVELLLATLMERDWRAFKVAYSFEHRTSIPYAIARAKVERRQKAIEAYHSGDLARVVRELALTRRELSEPARIADETLKLFYGENLERLDELAGTESGELLKRQLADMEAECVSLHTILARIADILPDLETRSKTA
ncbi:MAG: hypothetical protein KGI41_00200 [Patescibacteria group bacterium]|nr:hypothetical protein [Patescibacteria group bacterium]MDE1965653.1 hypothetical protein [Patescibacteria group bacterium]